MNKTDGSTVLLGATWVLESCELLGFFFRPLDVVGMSPSVLEIGELLGFFFRPLDVVGMSQSVAFSSPTMALSRSTFSLNIAAETVFIFSYLLLTTIIIIICIHFIKLTSELGTDGNIREE